jgi:hypothetical protein
LTPLPFLHRIGLKTGGWDMRNVKFIFLIFFFIISSHSYGAEKQKLSVQEVYGLQERCGKSADEFFKKQYGRGLNFVNKNIDQFYICHYNKKLNKCFIRITTIYKNEQDEKTSLTLELSDIQENLMYGFFSEGSNKFSCTFAGQKCNSQNEWNSLALSYMNE